MKTKYLWLAALVLGFTACQDDDILANATTTTSEPLPALTAGSADFSNYVALGASFTAGYTDGALFKAGQEDSFPNTLAKQFANASGGVFTQPLMEDNTGGMIIPIPGVDDLPYRLIFNGEGPQRLDEFFADQGAPAPTINTVAGVNLGAVFNNVGAPGAKSTHIDFNGYAAFNPYFGRMATSATVSMLEYAIAQNPTFFTLSEIGGNDVLGYATSGGESDATASNYDPITPTTTFDFVVTDMVNQLTTVCPNGVVTNVPYITDLPHFTTIPYNPIPLDAATAGLLNQAYAGYNGGLQVALSAGLISSDEATARTIVFSESETNTMVIVDENITDLSGLGLPSYRQTTASDLFVLPLSGLIPQGYGTQIPLADKWVLTPEEQLEIKTATDAYNTTIASVASDKGLALVDLNAILSEASTDGVVFDDYNLTTDLVTGGLVSLDGIHLNARGYAYMANKFLEAIDETYGSNFVASGNVAKADDFGVTYSPLLQ